MTVLFVCPHCGAQTEVDDQYVGQSGPCYCCRRNVTVPAGPRDPNAWGTARAIALIVVVICAGVFVGILLLGTVYWMASPLMVIINTASQQSVCESNLRQIARAMENYHDVHGSYPPAFIPDAKGKPMHSWRVLLLPQLGHSWLYKRYDFDEPWDSEQNLPIADRMPSVFACPADQGAELNGETSYMLVVGAETLFPGAKATRRDQVTDGLANTLMVVEVTTSQVTWTEPKDLNARQMSFAVNGPSNTEIGSFHVSGAFYATADGKTYRLDDFTPPDIVAALTTIQGNEPVTPSDSNESR